MVGPGREPAQACPGQRVPVAATPPVGPDDDPDFVRSEARRLGADGFKVYHDRVPQADTWNADIPQYMPEWLAEIADGFLWLRPEMVAVGRTGGVSLDPTLIGIENLGSLKHSC